MDVQTKQHLPHFRTLRKMNNSDYITLPREWHLPDYARYLVQYVEPNGRIILDPAPKPGDAEAA
jgi:virulence-associated protein VagC